MPNPRPEPAASHAVAATSSHGRLIEVLDALVRRAEGEPWGVRELASELDESRSTINRILAALVERDLAAEDGAGKYRVGPRLRVLMQAVSTHSAVWNAAGKLLDELAGDAKQSALLSVYAPHCDGYFVLCCGEAAATLAFRPQLGAIYPLGFGDIGRAFADHLNSGAQPDQQQLPVPVNNGQAMAESEFPAAVALATRCLPQGLLVTVSLHDLGAGGGSSASAALRKVEQVLNHLEGLPVTARACPQVRGCDEDSATAARLEVLLQILCAVPDGYPCKAGIAAELQCNSATARKIVESAAQASLVFASGQALYPAARLYQWAAVLGDNRFPVAKLCRAIVEALVKQTGETVAFLSFDACSSTAQFIEVAQGWKPIQYKLETGVEVPLYAGAAGKAVLAHLAPEFADGLTLNRFTEATIVSHSALQADLLAIRERGWSQGDGERVLGAFGIGVPFFVDGQVAGSLSATIPQYRKQDCDVAALVDHMKLATSRISRLLSLGTAPAQGGSGQ